ncbi:MAG: malto-oligosyltrehalose trehalohydrolase [Chitinivibrionales bacterium]|nr:malto-oligosyltrehalose trehalohydrolase [Chitinivibrionales bacterium]
MPFKPGAWYTPGKCTFTVWAPHHEKITLELLRPRKAEIPMDKDPLGYWHCLLPELPAGSIYQYCIDDSIRRPDPASFTQPEGVHGPSQVVDHTEFAWEDQKWKGILLHDYIIYEFHIGTFTDEGTLLSATQRLNHLVDLGITAVELMPVAHFPGNRNWGYDGVYPFAVHTAYGGINGLKDFVNECHKRGLAVILDVVYNHLGPEGNYMRDFGPYFTDKYKTPWGDAVNFDGPFSDEVRRYFIANALYWYEYFHIDALRLDAVHAIYDFSAKPFLAQLADEVHEWSRSNSRMRWLIAESDLNDSRLIRPASQGGLDIDAQWSDDFHHALHVQLTGENQGILGDFTDSDVLAKALNDRFVYDGRYSNYRKRTHGNPAVDLARNKFVLCIQNHDQVGNRARGERMSLLVDFESRKCAAAVLLLSPYIPLMFMGEEYGEANPFLYFVDHTDPDLQEAVRKGRKEEFAAFHVGIDPPDPFAEDTFFQSKLQWSRTEKADHAILLGFYRTCIGLRREYAFAKKHVSSAPEIYADNDGKFITIIMETESGTVVCLFNFADHPASITRMEDKSWEKVLDSSDPRWNGPGSLLPALKKGSLRKEKINGKCSAVFVAA